MYTELQKEAQKMGLRAGAPCTKKQYNPWRPNGLGWDPGHIDVGFIACKAKLKKMK